MNVDYLRDTVRSELSGNACVLNSGQQSIQGYGIAGGNPVSKITFVPADGWFTPSEGDQITFDGVEYSVDQVIPRTAVDDAGVLVDYAYALKVSA